MCDLAPDLTGMRVKSVSGGAICAHVNKPAVQHILASQELCVKINQ